MDQINYNLWLSNLLPVDCDIINNIKFLLLLKSLQQLFCKIVNKQFIFLGQQQVLFRFFAQKNLKIISPSKNVCDNIYIDLNYDRYNRYIGNNCQLETRKGLIILYGASSILDFYTYKMLPEVKYDIMFLKNEKYGAVLMIK